MEAVSPGAVRCTAHWRIRKNARVPGRAPPIEKVVPENVVETPAGKAVDTRKQTLSNTAWLMEAAKRIRELEKKVG